MLPTDVHVLTPGICEYVTLHSKKGLALLVWSKFSETELREVLLDYL